MSKLDKHDRLSQHDTFQAFVIGYFIDSNLYSFILPRFNSKFLPTKSGLFFIQKPNGPVIFCITSNQVIESICSSNTYGDMKRSFLSYEKRNGKLICFLSYVKRNYKLICFFLYDKKCFSGRKRKYLKYLKIVAFDSTF